MLVFLQIKNKGDYTMDKNQTKKELIEEIESMLNNAEYEQVLYFYHFVGLKLGVLKSEKEV